MESSTIQLDIKNSPPAFPGWPSYWLDLHLAFWATGYLIDNLAIVTLLFQYSMRIGIDRRTSPLACHANK